MAVSTVEVAESGMKQAWTGERFEKQYYAKDPLLEEIERRKPEISIGLEALTPIQTGRTGGITMVPKTGSGELNSPGSQDTNRAKWEYKRQWGQIELDTGVIERTKDKAAAIMKQVDLEVEGKLSDMRKQLTRMLFADQTGLIAQCAKEESESTKVKLLKTGFGYQAIRNGYLVAEQEIDIGSKTEQGLKIAKKPIISVEESEETPVLVIGTKIKTAETDYVSLANSRSGETSYETNGFRNMSSETTTLGGLKPETVNSWKGIVDPQKSTPVTRAKVLKLKRKLRQKGETPDWCFTSLKSVETLETELFTQRRFNDGAGLNTGDGESVSIGNLVVQGHNDCPEEDLYMCVKNHLFILRDKDPYWATQEYGGSMLMYRPGTTYVNGAVEFLLELATDRRNSIGRLSELS